jgi:hypothetical protein
MKKLSLLTSLFFILVIIGSCGSDSTTTAPPVTTGTVYEKDLIEFSGSVLGETHVYFKTTKRTKLNYEFTGETDAGNSNFNVVVEAAQDTVGGAITTNIFNTSDQATLNKTHTVVTNDLSSYDPLYLIFRVSLTRPPSGTKFVRLKNIKVTVAE